MMVLHSMGCIDSHKNICLIVSLVATACIAPIFDKATDFILAKKVSQKFSTNFFRLSSGHRMKEQSKPV